MPLARFRPGKAAALRGPEVFHGRPGARATWTTYRLPEVAITFFPRAFMPATMAVNVGEPYYVEHVTGDVEGTRALLEATHGWRFGEPDPVLGGAVVAKLPGGGRCGVRAPLRADENPVTRVYVRVESVARTVDRARKKGAWIAIESMKLGKYGTIAIFLLAGIEHAIWQLPARRP